MVTVATAMVIACPGDEGTLRHGTRVICNSQHDVLPPGWVWGEGFLGHEGWGGANLKRHLHVCMTVGVCKRSEYKEYPNRMVSQYTPLIKQNSSLHYQAYHLFSSSRHKMGTALWGMAWGRLYGAWHGAWRISCKLPARNCV